MSVQFGEFTFDRPTRLLRRGGKDIRLTPKAFELLDLLLRERPRVVSKEQIHAHLWPKTFVSESTLATVVTDLRTALAGDAKKPRFLRTVHRVGYAFCGEAVPGPAERAVTGSSYRLLLADREIPLRDGENILGRSPAAIAWIDGKGVSRGHARIVTSPTSATIEDLASKNGTFVKGRRVSAPVVLGDGDEIRLGGVKMTFRVLHPGLSTATDDGR